VALISKDSRATTAFYEIVSGNMEPDTGNYRWGVTTKQAYLPADNESFFQEDMSLVDWLRQYAKTEEEREDVYLRGFLGKMLFSGDDALKSVKVLSGGEKVRAMLSRMMMMIRAAIRRRNRISHQGACCGVSASSGAPIRRRSGGKTARRGAGGSGPGHVLA